MLAIEINEPAHLKHVDALALARDVGATAIPLTVSWSTIEPRAGVFDAEAARSALMLYARAGFRVLLAIGVADGERRLLPADLGRLRWNDAKLSERFRTMVAKLLDGTSAEIDYIVLGNEIDTYLAARPREWDDFRAFAGNARAAVRRERPGMRFGVALTLGGLDGRTQRLIQNQDAVVVTHYVVPRAEPMAPSDLAPRLLRQALAFAATRPLVVKEWGYPSGTAIGGSERGQAEFLAATIAEWRRHGDRIPFLGLARLHDDEPEECERLARESGLGGNPAFIALQCTTGLRTIENEPKAAWARIKAAMGGAP